MKARRHGALRRRAIRCCSSSSSRRSIRSSTSARSCWPRACATRAGCRRPRHRRRRTARVGMHFDPLRPTSRRSSGRSSARPATLASLETAAAGRLIEIPVQLRRRRTAPISRTVAAFAGCTPDEVIARHSDAHLPRLHARVRARLRLPGRGRRGRSRRRGAACRASACRPGRSASPGGRPASIRSRALAAGSSIGRTPWRMFDADRGSPSRWSRPATWCASCRWRRQWPLLGEGPRHERGAADVVRPGLLTTVQDLGRWGHQATGVPVAGPMDTFSHRLANAAGRQRDDAATLEITLIGPELIVEADATVAMAGAAVRRDVNGDRPWPPARRSRSRRRPALSSAASRRAPAPTSRSPAAFRRRRCSAAARRIWSAAWAASTAARCRPAIACRSATSGARRAPLTGNRRRLTLPSRAGALLRVMPGPQDDWFAPQALEALTSVSFRVSPQSNRMGYRLEGPPLPRGARRRADLRAGAVRRDSGAGRRGSRSC